MAAIHLLEHFTDDQLPAALANLLEVTAHRLVIAVPYESETQSFYGHQQVFTPTTLRRWGQWCIERLGGGRYLYEEVSGGFLVIERPGQTPANPWSPA